MSSLVSESGFNRRKAIQKTAITLLVICTVVVVLPVVFVFGFIIYYGAPALSWEFLTQSPSFAGREGGIFPAIVGTFYLMIGTVMISVPVGALAAVYLTEYAKQNRLTRIINLAIVNLAGVPSIVYGLFGLAFFVMAVDMGMSLIAASLTLACQALCLVVTSSREALLTVPAEHREASLALGTSKWQTVRHIAIPGALPGILTGTVLAMSRAAGETAPILAVGAAFFLPRLPGSPFDQFMALSYHLYTVSVHVPGVPKGAIWGTALVLLMVVLTFNVAAIIMRIRVRKKKK